jgi:hypothetical protein
MKFSWNIVTQICGTVLQVINANSSVIPARYQAWVACALGVVQAISGLAAHFSNPDGTPATEPWKA